MKRGKPERYIALAEDIRKFIHSHKLKRDDALPSERKLSQLFNASHLTVRKSLKLLVDQNLIYKIPSLGNFVGEKPPGKSSGLIGLLLPEEDIFFFEIQSELEKLMDIFGYHPIVHITYGSMEKELNILNFFKKTAIDALIAVPNQTCRNTYQQLNIPTVFFDISLENLQTPYVVADDNEGTRQAVEHLINLGHKKIAHIGGQKDATCRIRLETYINTLKKHHIKSRKNYIKSKEYSRQWGYYATQELLREKEKPTAIFCGNDAIAAGSLRYLRRNHIKCPDDISIIGFANTSIAEDLELTSISQPRQEIAGAIWNNLQMLIKGEKPPLSTKIGTELIVRKSTAIAP